MDKTELNKLLYEIKKEKDKNSSVFSITIIILTFLIVTIPLVPIFIIIFCATPKKYESKENNVISYLKEIYHQEINDLLKNELFIEDEKLDNLISWAIKRGEEDVLKKLNDFFSGKLEIDEIYNFNYTKNKITEFHIDSLNKKSLQNKVKLIEEQKIKNLENFILEHKEYKIIEFSVNEAYKNILDQGMQLLSNNMFSGTKIYFISKENIISHQLNNTITISGVFAFGDDLGKKRHAFVGKINRILDLNLSTIRFVDERNLSSSVFINDFVIQKTYRIYNNHCWSCKSIIDNKKNFLCPKCKKYYICSECGKCVCGHSISLWHYHK